jgi:uncharacterized damage-inducible protein DinB
MSKNNLPEVWLRGPLPGIAPLLQPAAHALLQARDEVHEMTTHFPDALLWQKPAGVASAGFHLQHLTGVLDRLFTYARAESLSAKQLQALAAEGHCAQEPCTVQVLVENFHQQVDQAIEQLSQTDEATLPENRTVGRAQLPSTVIGLYFHAAEHTMRHVGQLHVTIKVLMQHQP